METQTETAVTTATVRKPVKSRLPELAPELQARFIAYFTKRYPQIKSIRLGRHYARYVVKARYRDEVSSRRIFWTVALDYEQLVMRADYVASTVRGLKPERPVR